MKHKKTILVTAGPTREKIDPIRYISNESTGRLGFEIAKAAKQKGLRVILILGPTHLPAIKGIETIHIQSAVELTKAVKKYIQTADILFMTAAVADFTPARAFAAKLKRKGPLAVHLKKTEDILRSIAKPSIKRNKIYVGFCLETENVLANAKQKLVSKNLDYIVATHYQKNKPPFGDHLFSPLIIKKDQELIKIPLTSKPQFARKLLDLVLRES